MKELKTNKYESFFSNWLYNNLPDSSEGQLIMDIDFLFSNYKTKKFIFIELKTRGNNVSYSQREMYSMLHKRLIKTNGSDGWEYKGTHLITFQKDNFDDGTVELDGKFIKEYELLYFIEQQLL